MNFDPDKCSFWTIKLSCFCYGFMHARHCGLENNITFLSPTPKMDGGHESRAKSVWEIRIIKILDLPPQRDNSLKVGRSK